MIEGAIYNELYRHAPVSDIVDDRIYLAPLPADCRLPAVTYRLTGVHDYHTYDGASNLLTVDVIVDAWSKKPTGAAKLALEINRTLQGGVRVMDGLDVQAIYRRDVTVVHEPEAGGWRRSQTYEIFYRGEM